MPYEDKLCSEIDDYLADPYIAYHKSGDCAGEWIGGEATRSGFYIYPFCDPMCCRPEGPFTSEENARQAARTRLSEVRRRHSTGL